MLLWLDSSLFDKFMKLPEGIVYIERFYQEVDSDSHLSNYQSDWF